MSQDPTTLHGSLRAAPRDESGYVGSGAGSQEPYVAPIVRSYLLSLAATRVTVRLRSGERAVLHGINSSCNKAKVRVGNRFVRVPVTDLCYVIDPTDPEEAP